MKWTHVSSELLAGYHAVLTSVIVVSLLGASAVALNGQVQTQPTQNALAGSQVYGAKGCVKCHAIDGLGGTEGPDLARFPRPRTFYDLAAAMWNHRPRMVERMRALRIERPRLNARETGDLIAFLYTLDYFDTPGDADKGKQLFAEKRCITCHQMGGVGGVVGPVLGARGHYVAPIQFATAMWNHGPSMTEAMQAQGISRPRFTSTELADLIAFLESDAPDVPTGPLYVLPGLVGDGNRVFQEKGCIRCHAVRGEGADQAPDLSARAVYRSLLGFAAAMWNKAPAMLGAMRRQGIDVPRLRPEEMADLVGYLYSVQYFAESGNQARGQRVVRNKGCLDCHSLNGRGGTVGPDLAESRSLATPGAVIAALWNHTLLDEETASRITAWPVLRANEMADLTAYLESLARRSR